MKSLKPLLLSNLLSACAATLVWAGQMSTQNGEYVITKDLIGASGSAMVSAGGYTLGWALGEASAGTVSSASPYQSISGYFGGRLGNGQSMQVISFRVGLPGAKT